MPVPKIFVLVDWNHDSTNNDSYEEIAADVEAINITYGKDKEMSKVQAAEMTITVNNYDHKYSPPNASSVLNDGGRNMRQSHWIEIIAAYPFDEFTGSNGTNLASHTPDYDSSFAWSIKSGAFSLDGAGKAKCTSSGIATI